MADWVCWAAICKSHYPRHLLGAFPTEARAEEYATTEGEATVEKFFRLATCGEQTNLTEECPDHRKRRR